MEYPKRIKVDSVINKQPVEWVKCPQCNLPYDFLRCRIADSKGKNLCMRCALDEEKKLSTENII